MANKPASASDPDDADQGVAATEWETVNANLGKEWDFERDGALTGHFLGTATVETDKVESGVATAYRFSPQGDPESLVFIWGSSEIVGAFSRMIPDTDQPIIAIGDLVRIKYLGRDAFTGAKGPQQIKRYAVQIPKAGQPRA